MRLLVTGDVVDAEKAQAIGLVNEVVAPSDLDGAVDDLARRIAAHSGTVVGIGKQAFYRQAEMSLEDAYAHAGPVMAPNMIEPDPTPAHYAFPEKPPPPRPP